MLDQTSDFLEMIRGVHPCGLFLYFVPLFAILTMAQYPTPAAGAIEFPVHRMQQIDLLGSGIGCRSSVFNFEARSLPSALTAIASMARRSIVARLHELDSAIVKKLLAENVGSLLVLLPKDLHDGMAKDNIDRLIDIETALYNEETQVPVYFATETVELQSVYQDICASNGVGTEKAATALQALMGSTTSNGFQLVVGSSPPKSLPDFAMVNLQGRLPGYGLEDQNPTIALVAHYDAVGVSPSLARGADSNASGVVALLEIARIFAKLYANKLTHSKVNFIFLLAAGGKLNYMGTKKWLDYQLDENVESDLSSNVKYVLCLDALAGSEDKDNLYLHVSKPPKEGTAGNGFWSNLEAAGAANGVGIKMIHKKINLKEDFLAWEHEKVSIRRLQGFTISALPHHKIGSRRSVTDIKSSINQAVLERNIGIVTQALAADVFGIPLTLRTGIPRPSFLTEIEGFPGLDENVIASNLDFLTSLPRAQQLLHKDSQVVQTLNLTLSKYLGYKETKKLLFKADPREPEWVLYDSMTMTMQAFNVKPAIFDLILACGIAVYLISIYLLVSHFHILKMIIQPMIYHHSINGMNGKAGSPCQNGHAKKM